MRASRSGAVAVLAAGLLAGCGSMPPPSYYTLRPAAPAGPVAAVAEDGLEIGVVGLTVDPPYDQDRLVYRRGAGSPEVGFYAYHRWAAPVGRMLGVALAESLAGAPGIAAVEPASAGGRYTAWLEGRVTELAEVEMAGGSAGRVRLELRLRTTGGELLWSDTLAASAAGTAGTGAEAMALVQAALSDALQQVRASLSAALER